MIRRPCFPPPSESALAFLSHNFLYLDHNKSKLPRFIGPLSPLNAINNDLVSSNGLPELEHWHIIEIAALSHPSIILNPIPLAWRVKNRYGLPLSVSYDT
jgi:hypothetical protein